MVRLLLLMAPLAWAGSGPSAFSDLKKNQNVSGFSTQALYLNASDEPMGARFVHPNGMPVDVLFFASVPQVSLYARTTPVSEKGEPHTLEHLLIGKGRIGKYLNSLLRMRLANHTAGTHQDLTNYQFYSSAGPEGFYELLEKYLQALIKPEFTDEEIRREVANLQVAEDSKGKLLLEEKGTVYTEMISSMEKPGSVNWDQLGRMVFGPEHPLARNQGGKPAAIRETVPKDIRRFHDANYHLGPNMPLIAALPLSWSAGDFLSRLDKIFKRIEPHLSTRTYTVVPPFQSLPAPEIRIGVFPSDNLSIPQTAFFAWKPIPDLSKEDSVRISLLLNILAGGETSYLYGDLVDQKTRKFDSGATRVWGFLDDPPTSFPCVIISGLPVSSIDQEALSKLRSAVVDRVRWMTELKPGSAELEEIAEKAGSLILSRRRGMLKFMDDPPHFGERGSGAGWHRLLDHLNQDPDFKKSVSLKGVYDRLLHEVNSGKNPWSAIAKQAGLLELSYVSAVKPDAGILHGERKDTIKRLAVHKKKLMQRFGVDDLQLALAKLKSEIEVKTQELEARDRNIPKPGFVKDPPLTLDDIDYTQERLSAGPKLVRTHFGSTPFTDIHILFDLTRVPEEDLYLLPLLSTALSDLGVKTQKGEILDYVKARERIRSEIYSLGVDDTANPATGRVELYAKASASSPDEVEKAVGWLESYLLHPVLGPDSRERLIDLVCRNIKSYRNIFQQSEESWVTTAASAYVYQDQPVYMALNSPFTVLRHLSRLRWQLEDPSGKELASLEAALSAVETSLKEGKREILAKYLKGVEGEMGEYLRFELAYLPSDTWQSDLSRVLKETREDLGIPSSEVIGRLKKLIRNVLVRSGARVHIMGNSVNADRAAKLMNKLSAELPENPISKGRPARKALVIEQLKERYPGIKRPAHVALVNNGTKTGVHVISAKGVNYHSRQSGDILDFLAVGVFSGAGPHSFFMKTWSAGLAYSNGVNAGLGSGKLRYHAERFPKTVPI